MVTLNVFQKVIIALVIIFGLGVLVCTIYVTLKSKYPKWLLWVITLALEAEFILFSLKVSGVELTFLLHKINICVFLTVLVLWLWMIARALDSEEKKKRAGTIQAQFLLWFVLFVYNIFIVINEMLK